MVLDPHLRTNSTIETPIKCVLIYSPLHNVVNFKKFQFTQEDLEMLTLPHQRFDSIVTIIDTNSIPLQTDDPGPRVTRLVRSPRPYKTMVVYRTWFSNTLKSAWFPW